jgi:hypothetical protein
LYFAWGIRWLLDEAARRTVPPEPSSPQANLLVGGPP